MEGVDGVHKGGNTRVEIIVRMTEYFINTEWSTWDSKKSIVDTI